MAEGCCEAGVVDNGLTVLHVDRKSAALDAALMSNAHPFRFSDAPTLFVGLHGSKMIGLRFAINGFRL